MILHLREIMHVCEVQDVGMPLNICIDNRDCQMLHQKHQNYEYAHLCTVRKSVEGAELWVGGTMRHITSLFWITSIFWASPEPSEW